MLQKERAAMNKFVLFYNCNTSFFREAHSHPHLSRFNGQ
ncbi:phosphotransacetylase [Bacillus pseudomycoides]|uniref:Phosphotransacetylase n=1 Tax=Bacillus pseudomycoides TaxID=64104 RepID=A0AA91V7U0_9BACI|nr:phosphotransacetylase [Bacillus sp. AFS098217]PED80146.1 phosphotransacetylase [Bacillus pseudomycoides]PEU10412.1 phosphotransacetylase [Bacillus sp. AFS019443]PEU18605.1 phosphotransacetylase [Bacillus sp. AFS014408]PFW60357.1 phosphotransacetylase [Bacillus sp. AFS075034]